MKLTISNYKVTSEIEDIERSWTAARSSKLQLTEQATFFPGTVAFKTAPTENAL